MKTRFIVISKLFLLSTLFAFSTANQAGQFYLGAQATNISAELDYGATESYDLNPTRIELGWTTDAYYVAVHVLTSGKDTDVDFTSTTFEMELDTSFGLFVGTSFGAGKNFYAAAGLQTFDTSYRQVPFSFKNEDNILTLGLLIGAQYELTQDLFLYGDFSMYFGTASYPTWFTADPDFTAMGFAGGLKYEF